jgi:hypothetical protein
MAYQHNHLTEVGNDAELCEVIKKPGQYLAGVSWYSVVHGLCQLWEQISFSREEADIELVQCALHLNQISVCWEGCVLSANKLVEGRRVYEMPRMNEEM